MGALNDVKILDFSTLLPGPYATMLLADLGADVLKITGKDRKDLLAEWPPMIKGGDVSASWAWVNRNKRTIYLNLKKHSGVEVVKKLVNDYDIIIEQFRPGVMEQLGLSYEVLKTINPRLIYCSLTGYGQTGPIAKKAGHDINYLARSGILSAAGKKDSGPALYNFQIADIASGAMNLVAGVLAALHYRDITGKGQYIDIAMADGVIPFNSMDGAGYLAGAKPPERENQQLNGGGIYDFYQTKDGEYMSVGSLEPKFFAQLCVGMGYPQWSDGEILKKSPELVKNTFRQCFLSKTRDEWIAVFKDLDACVEPVLSLEEAVEDAQNNYREMWVDVPVATAPEKLVKQMGCPIKLSECPAEYRASGYPAGYHTKEVLQKLGYTDDEIQNIVMS